jgi:hypothetical protein
VEGLRFFKPPAYRVTASHGLRGGSAREVTPPSQFSFLAGQATDVALTSQKLKRNRFVLLNAAGGIPGALARLENLLENLLIDRRLGRGDAVRKALRETHKKATDACRWQYKPS